MLIKLRRYFLSGLIVFLPVALTVYLFIWTINWADNLLGKFIQPYFYNAFGFYIQGLGLVIGVLLVIFIGVLATNFFGNKIHGFFERVLLKLPFFKQVYPAIKEIALFLFSRDKVAFKQVVLLEYPRKGIYAFGFITNQTPEKVNKITKEELCNIFIPSAPGPVTGYVLMVPKKDIIFVDISVEEAIKFNVSGGVVNPIM